MSNYSSKRILKLTLSQFSGWDELKETGTLSSEAASRRASEIKQAVYGEGSLFAQTQTQGNTASSRMPIIDDGQIRTLAQSRFPIVEASRQILDGEFDTSSYFADIIKYGADEIVSPPQGKVRFVFPGIFDKGFTFIDYTDVYTAAVMLVSDAKKVSPQEQYSHFTAIPKQYLTNLPTDGWGVLAEELHEFRHVLQGRVGGVLYDRGRELDADLFPRAVLRQANVGAQTLVATMNARYIDLLASQEQYWFAPTMEALESSSHETRKNAPTFDDVSRAVTEMRTRIIMERNGAAADSVDFSRLNRDFGILSRRGSGAVPDQNHSAETHAAKTQYERQIVEPFYRHGNHMPLDLFQNLRAVVEKGIFSTPLAAAVAERTLEAANYFAPALVAEPDIQAARNRRITAEQGRPFTPAITPAFA